MTRGPGSAIDPSSDRVCYILRFMDCIYIYILYIYVLLLQPKIPAGMHLYSAASAVGRSDAPLWAGRSCLVVGDVHPPRDPRDLHPGASRGHGSPVNV